MIYSDEFATKITQRQILYFQSRGCVGNCDWLRTNCWRDSTAACSKVGFLLTAFSNLGKLLLWENQNHPTRMGFEPTRAEHIGLAVQRLNHSATSSSWRRLSPPCQSTTLKSHRVHGQNVPTPGVEPGPSGWKPDILAVRPRGNNMFSPGIEPGTFCVLDRCDNRYTTKTLSSWQQVRPTQ